ncbi:MAG: PTS sugar transporter subunit IIC [Clostridia bacterium]
MNAFNDFMEKHFVPVAAKIGSQKHLVAIRDAFIGIMPVTMAGSIAVLLNVFFRDLPAAWAGYAVAAGNQGLADVFTNFANFMLPIVGINGNVWWGSIAILALVFVFSLGYNISKAYDVNPLAGGLVAFASLITTIPQMATFDATISGVTETVAGWGYLPWGYTQVTGLFSALIVGFITSMIYVTLMKKKVGIKLPDSVPPAVSGAFAAIIPGLVAIYVAATASYLVTTYTGQTINDLIQTYIQTPLLGLSQGLGSVIIITILVQLFWFFGLHGTNVLAPVLDGIYKTALLENNAAFSSGTAVSDLQYIWTRGSFDAFAWMGGAGCSLALIVAIFIFSKREDQRAVAKMSAPMGVFNINEPVVFGLPLVLNPIYIIPFIFVPVILVVIAYLATAIGLVPPVFVEVPWVMPPVIYAFLATGGSPMAALLALVNFVIGTVLWAPFVMLANKVKMED